VKDRTEADAKRLLHELQVHQIELEMQNAELQEARNKVETLLETYTDLYDFAPVGYFSVDEQGLILEVNLTGAALLGIERSRLINRRLQGFVDPPSRKLFWLSLRKYLQALENRSASCLF
jgi:PAS domain-containing protein